MMVNTCRLACRLIDRKRLWLALTLLLLGLTKTLAKAMPRIISSMQNHNVQAAEAVAQTHDLR